MAPIRAAIAVLLVSSGFLADHARAQESIAPSKVALLVGVNRYDKRGFADRPLQYAERDVDELAAVLQEQGFTVRLLKGSSEGADRATKAGIEAALDQVLDGRKASDVVLVAFAGHGQQLPLRDAQGAIRLNDAGQPLEDAFFCAVDAVKGESHSMVSLTGLMQTLDRKGGVNLVLVDACRDNPDPGRSTRSITGNELNGRLPSNTAIVFSCAAGQQALETQDAGGGHGVFFYHVLEGLKGEAARNNGDVTWSSLVDYVRDHTNQRALEWFPDFATRVQGGELQTPHELRNLIRMPVLAKIGLISPGSLKPGDIVSSTIGTKLVLVPAGEFLMGLPANEAARSQDAGPQHRVQITNAFLMGQNEITQGEWSAVMGSNYSWFSNLGDGKDKIVGLDSSRFPVEWVSWYDVVEFCNKLSERDKLSPYYALEEVERADGSIRSATVSINGGHGYRLPTEAEWEYACRGGTTTAFHFGPTSNGREANVNGSEPHGTLTKGPNLKRTTTVGSYLPNAFGLYDLHGNVWEWCADWYDHTAYQGRTGATRDPLVSSAVKSPDHHRTIRGGSFSTSAGFTRSADRNWGTPNNRAFNVGFRLARTP